MTFMTYEMYRYVFFGALIACGLFFLIAVALFFVLSIPTVISDLTGRTARKAIEDIRKQNEQSGDKTYRSSAVNRERGKLTDKISQSGRLVPRGGTPFGTGFITEKISTQQLDTAGETDVLSATEDFSSAAGETDVLNATMGQTDVLAPAESVQGFTVEFEITFIHTNEVIT